jgi:deoxyhypusine synthase
LFSSFFQARQLIDEKTLEKESRKKLVNNMIKSERYRSLESKLSSTSKKIDNDVKR